MREHTSNETKISDQQSVASEPAPQAKCHAEPVRWIAGLGVLVILGLVLSLIVWESKRRHVEMETEMRALRVATILIGPATILLSVAVIGMWPRVERLERDAARIREEPAMLQSPQTEPR